MVKFPTFKEYLAELPNEVVFRHFLSRQSQGRKILSSASINDITHQMTSEKSIRERFMRLSPDARHTCSLVYLFGKRGLEAPKVSGFDDELLSSFLIFAGRDEAGRTSYFGFPEFEIRLSPLAAEILIQNARPTPQREPTPLLPWLCLRDIVVLCICASEGILKTTKKGDFAKVSENAIQGFLHASHDLTADEAVIPHRLLFGYVLDKGLVEIDKDMYRPRTHAIVAWLSLPLDQRYADFCEFAIAAAPLWSKTLLDALLAGARSHWLNICAVDDAVRKDARIVLACLRYLGVLDVQKSGATYAFTNPKQVELPSSPSGRIILLADFSAVLTREVLPEELYWFSKAGTLESFDSVYRGMIRRQVINDSLSEGIPDYRIVEWLETWKAPANVLATAKEWIREFSRMYITSDATVVSFEERATNQILSYEPLKRIIEPVQCHSLFRIKPGREQEVRRILVTMGFDPRMPGDAFARKRNPDSETDKHAKAMASSADIAEVGLSLAEKSITPVTSFGHDQKPVARAVKAGKYGQRLKELDMSDMFHVLDYAVLMGHPVSFEYRGSPLVRKGLYKVHPLNVQKAAEPFCEALVLPNKTKKKFLLKCIVRLGVESA